MWLLDPRFKYAGDHKLFRTQFSVAEKQIIEYTLNNMTLFLDAMSYRLYGDIIFLAPVFIPAKNSPDLINHYLLLSIKIIEFVAITFSLPVTFLHNYSLKRSVIFHPNLVRISQVYLGGNYFTIIARLVTHLYQTGVFHYDESNSFSKILLFVASVVRSYFFISTMSFLAEVIVERIFALYYVVDYELKPRLWISTSIIAITLVITLFVTVTMMIQLYSIKVFIAAKCITVTIFLIIFVVVYRQNVSRLHELRSGMVNAKTKNTISTKFQLMENVRVMKAGVAIISAQSLDERDLVMIAFTVAWVLIFLGLALCALALFAYPDQLGAGQLCFALLDLLVALSTAAGFFAFLLIFNGWRQALRKCPLALKFCRGFLLRLDKAKRNVDEHRGATDHYFNQLREAWQ